MMTAIPPQPSEASAETKAHQTEDGSVVWLPDHDALHNSNMAHFKSWLEKRGHGPFADYHQLHRWSVAVPEMFWQTVWDYCGLIEDHPADAVLQGQMPNARWFTGMQLNFAENLLRFAEGDAADSEAVVAYSETRPVLRRTFRALRDDVGALEAFLKAQGVQRGSRVAAIVTNGYEALVGMLAANSMGAIWSSASPDFGSGALLDRFGQIEPDALITVNGYGYGGKHFSRHNEIEKVIEGLPTLRCVLSIQQLPDQAPLQGALITSWDEALQRHRGRAPSFTSLPADHPVCILFSSGTTGKPKCIIHGAAGLLVNHAKELMLHGDVRVGDRFMYFTTCGWMMWNWQASALLAGATVITVDGSPGYPSLDKLWALSESERVSHFGTSARYLASCRKSGLAPVEQHELSNLRMTFSTGSPLLPEDYDWFYASAAPGALLGSIAGGTDICGCFVGCTPLLPVRRGEIQCAFLGVDVLAYDADGTPLQEGKGELVCRQPLPSMPLGFWQDSDGSRYRSAYFDRFKALKDGPVWAHGDFIRFTEHGGAIIYGRSDSTLNPGGVRIGTAEIYRQVESDDAVADSLVVGRQIEGDVEIVLLVVPSGEPDFDAEQERNLRTRIRLGASPRHVPKHILVVEQIPYTRSGKKMELAVARLLNEPGATPDNRDAMANPEALDSIREVCREARLIG
ncbi:acetoacetate--CoA ligase [Allohahella sp. A8]|uniref:acetoacetate--CoA ligase n=1 Tax=Allohahella sp. A8 TaxID=3141461 RepID=UPI003A80066F